MKLKKIVAFAVVLALAFTLAACGNGGGNQAPATGNGEAPPPPPDERFTLMFNHVLTPGHPYHAGFEAWADAVYARSGGRLNIEVFHSAQLGVEEDIIEQIRAGANIGQNTDSARLGMYVPEIAVMNGPFFMESLEEVLALYELDKVQEWLRILREEEGIKVLSFFWVQGHRHVISNRPVRHPDDLAGERIRTPGAPIWQESVAAIGAVPVALPMGEVYTGIQGGVVDGAELVYANIYDMGLYEVASYFSETSHILLTNFSVISYDWFRSLPEDLQQILQEENQNAGLATSRYTLGGLADELRERLRELGMTIVTVDEIDLDAFRARSIQAYENLGLVETRDAIFAALGFDR